ncbi:streptogrisin C [Krasilnikovia cinnamomea]|uniref:Streptogrisin C n=1 Tax=Krasilnikovia cinnamomea TaxID=349313 RepID=A0A4Q7ZDN9_9ACTN|nr:S1 family peptidase [Krasilnikovia cinnamomea]RZU48331.1 streptogrisin C [Krasilnikovia cinnamomea]
MSHATKPVRRPLARIAGAALATVTAASLLGAPASGASPADPGAVPSREMVDQLAADLGLTTAQAGARIRAEYRASLIVAPARSAAGAAYGGAVFDPARANLVVGVTDPAALAQVRRTGAAARLVPHSLASLERTMRVLDARTAPRDVTGWRVDETANLVVVTAAGHGPTKPVRAFVAGLNNIRVDHRAPAVRTLAELIGGDAIYGGGSRCSLGFNARRTTGAYLVLTAGHCTNIATTWSGFNRVVIGTRFGTSFPTNDYGAINVNLAAWTPTPKIKGGVPVLGSAVAPVGSSVCRSGSTTGYRCGTVTARNQTVNYPQGTVSGLTRTSVCAESGDSGGPFVSSTRQAQGVTSGGSGNCTSGGTTFFQPLGEILTAYSATLVVG